ncbi:energy transducer TonB [uncultured Amphritea sp.]|uniref:energy transducer TonB n=1 Tax=uncultured Amphritea sp. TaxID=981605 RepID=UPI002604B156|nr:energy transducer TonB [uncultured Amphritea sp.]
MNSLLATLMELRIFIITLCVSGAVHLTLIGGGWLDFEDSVQLGGQPLNVTVTATRGDDSADTEDAVDILQQSDRQIVKHVDKRTEKSKAAAVESFHDNAVPASSLAQAETPLKPKPAVRPLVDSSPSSVPERKLILTQSEAGKAETPPVIPATQVAATPVADESVSSVQQSTLFYQSHPDFLTPPDQPQYPRLARKLGIEGQVILRVEIGRDGSVEGLRLEQSSGSDLLDQAARSAVQRWQFVPATQNGLAVASYVRVPIDFVLEGR